MSFQGKMIVLDLYSEVVPQYLRLKSYYGQPYIWCMLHDFGGTLPLYGTIQSVNQVTHFCLSLLFESFAKCLVDHRSRQTLFSFVDTYHQ